MQFCPSRAGGAAAVILWIVAAVGVAQATPLVAGATITGDGIRYSNFSCNISRGTVLGGTATGTPVACGDIDVTTLGSLATNDLGLRFAANYQVAFTGAAQALQLTLRYKATPLDAAHQLNAAWLSSDGQTTPAPPGAVLYRATERFNSTVLQTQASEVVSTFAPVAPLTCSPFSI